MVDAQLVEHLEPTDHTNKHLPDDVFFEKSLILLVDAYFLVEVTVIGILHHDAEKH